MTVSGCGHSLRKTVIYADRDYPSLLFSIPRRIECEEIGVSELLPLHGVDAYELRGCVRQAPGGADCVICIEPPQQLHIAMFCFACDDWAYD